MMDTLRFRLFCAALPVFSSAVTALASPVEIDIDCRAPAVPLSPHLYGLFFEDINYAADGGIYAELVQNRSFEYHPVKGRGRERGKFHPLYAWEKIERGGASCDLRVEDGSPLNPKNTHYVVVGISSSDGAAGLANTGFDGIRLDEGASYDVSFHARQSGWNDGAQVTAALELEDGTICGSTRFTVVGRDWQRHEGTLVSKRTIDSARLVLTTSGPGTLHLDMVSLFPKDTWKGRKGGLRKDLVQALADLQPKFFRFPGGCIAHGHGLDNIYRWKDTVGDVAERKPNWNRWGYHQTYGLGYYEYFLLCKDLGMHPLPVVPVGVSCGFTPPQEAAPMHEMQPWIDDALDLVEFANGPASSRWGGVRAKMGHPEPFGMKFLCLGNEPHDNALFRDRFPLFVNAIRDKHPEIKIIGTSGLGPEIPIYDLMDEFDVYSSDEHYYESPEWFIANHDRFDDFDRKGPKVFVGEYGSRGSKVFNAVAEAAFLTGVERNGDMVDMTCYAPLFSNVHHQQWHPDLIYFDKRTVVRTPSYLVQQLFACNKGDVYLANTIRRPKADAPPTISGAVGIGTWSSTIEVDSLRVNGKKLDPSDWNVVGGDFRFANGRYIQSDSRVEPAVSLGRELLDDETVTYEVRARKTGGREGFLLVFGSADGELYWWNVGGWGNRQHGLEQGSLASRATLAQTAGSVRANTWHDMKVELTPGRIRCLLDGKLIHDYEIAPPTICVSTTFDKKTGEVIVKLVNPTSESVQTAIRLHGAGTIVQTAKITVLTGDRAAVNTIENPDHIKTETRELKVAEQFAHVLPPVSVQFIRIKTG